MKGRSKYLLAALIILASQTFGSTQNPSLKFNENGKFKIAQFTDTHFNFGSEKSQVVLEMINEVLDAEKPDLVILTGDIVTKEPVEKGWRTIVEPMVSRGIPWAVTLGNHDDEQDLNREQLISLFQQIEMNCTVSGDKDVYGYGNYVLPIYNQNAEEVSALIFGMDSNAYPTIEGVGDYGWFHSSQIEWYQKTSIIWTKENSGQPLPALAFFHIPLPEYHEAWKKGDMKSIGRKGEKVCSPVINTGMFAAMLKQGDIMGIFVGHDHVNDYISTMHGIALAYGRFSGGRDTYGKLKNGSRIIELTQNKRGFQTWIRLRGGKMINKVVIN